jgi:hypothetical protein
MLARLRNASEVSGAEAVAKIEFYIAISGFCL